MTLFQFYKEYDTDEKCMKYLRSMRWPDGKIICPYCDHPKCYIIEGGNRYKCANNKCRKRFTIRVGTIFHASNVPLWQFFYFIFMTSINKKNTSSYQEALNLGITQKTTWYIMMRIRMLCYQDPNLMLSGDIEADETYMATDKWRRKKTSGRKLPVFGIIQRGSGKAIIKVIKNRNAKTAMDLLLRHVSTESRLFTDTAGCYVNCSSYYRHEVINHKEKKYVNGYVHTNTVENMWSHFKSAIQRTHNGVSLLHLQRYCDEFAYRWNTKEMTPLQRFTDLMKRACETKPINKKLINLHAREYLIKKEKISHEQIVEAQEKNATKVLRKNNINNEHK